MRTRGTIVARIIQECFLLSIRAYSPHELAERFNISHRTAKRDLVVIQQAGIPLFNPEVGLYRIDDKFMRRFF